MLWYELCILTYFDVLDVKKVRFFASLKNNWSAQLIFEFIW